MTSAIYKFSSENCAFIPQAMNSFSAALASGQLGPLMNQFNLGEDVVTAAAQGGDISD